MEGGNNTYHLKRRDFIKYASAAGGSLLTLGNLSPTVFAKDLNKSIKVINLPYPKNALEPYMSEKTITRHYDNHHKSYYNRLKMYLDANPEYGKYTLENLIKQTKGGISLEDALFNIAILLWAHNYYWQSMKPGGGISLEKENILTKKVIESFGTIKNFKNKFIEQAMEVGLGWVWLVKTSQGLKIVRMSYHDGPIPSDYTLLCTADIWEHAYYIDYGNDREAYINSYLNHLINWDFAQKEYLKKV